MRRLSCIIWRALKCNLKGPVWEPRRSKEEVGEMVTKASGCHDDEAVMSQGTRHPPEAGKGTETDSPLSLQKEPGPVHTLTVAQQNDSGLYEAHD